MYTRGKPSRSDSMRAAHNSAAEPLVATAIVDGSGSAVGVIVAAAVVVDDAEAAADTDGELVAVPAGVAVRDAETVAASAGSVGAAVASASAEKAPLPPDAELDVGDSAAALAADRTTAALTDAAMTIAAAATPSRMKRRLRW